MVIRGMEDSEDSDSQEIQNNTTAPNSRNKRKLSHDEDCLEDDYEHNQEEPPVGKIRNLLPIKTKDGFVFRQVVVANKDENSQEIEDLEVQENQEESGDSEDELFDINDSVKDIDISQPISVARLCTNRNDVLTQKKLKIGVLSSQILENPDEKISNLRLLLQMIDDKTPEVYVTVRKLAFISLLEVFKDIIPSYKIRNHADDGVLLKKTTFKLRKFETELLQHYKKFLQKLEKFCMALQRKKGNTKQITNEGQIFGVLAIQTMCELLITHPYFNFSDRIAQVIVPFLNAREIGIRENVKSTIKSVFKEDRKQEITLKILQVINHHLKNQINVSTEMIEVLLELKLKDIHSDDKQLDNNKKKHTRQEISKKERKRRKQLKHLENQLLETKGEENKKAKEKKMTEITKLVMGIYLRILKKVSNSKVVSICLEGLAKHAQFISIDYYFDILNMINELIKDVEYKEQLHCIRTVFIILSGEGEYINLDPTRFYNSLYKNLFNISAASKNHDLELLVLQILTDCLIKRRKKVSNKRLIGFVKRLSITALQLLHHGSLGSLGLIRNLIQLNKSIDILLDTDCSVGDGSYKAELEDPEYCDASTTALYEMTFLNDHYHPVVSKFAKNIANGEQHRLAPDLMKLTAEELFQNYDMSDMSFCPSVTVPQNCKPKSKARPNNNFLDSKFEELCSLEMKNALNNAVFCAK